MRKDRAKAIKNDAAHRLAILLDPDGEVGVAKRWEGEPEFHEAWKAKGRDLLAKAEFRRRKLTLRLKVRATCPFVALLAISCCLGHAVACAPCAHSAGLLDQGVPGAQGG